MEARIDATALKELEEKLAESPEIIKAAKRRAFEAAAPKLKNAVDSAIGGSGKVQSWQGSRVGSKGGYAAVSPRAKTYVETKSGKTYSVGQITNAIDKGHAIRRQSGRNAKYRPRVQVGFRVPGKQFYAAARQQVDAIAQQAVAQVGEELTKHLEG